MTKSLCSNCRNQMTGWDGGFFGEPVTCECRIYGVTEGRKSCSNFKKRVTKSDLLKKIHSLEKENEQLKNYFKKRAECSNFQINKLKEEIAELQEDNVDTIVELSKENEQLKEELNNLKKDETMLYHYYTLARYGGDGV